MARQVNPKKHAARRDEFIDAGMRLIQTRGYEQFSIDDLLAETRSSKGAFYHYFDSKQALLAAIVDRLASAGVATVYEVVADSTIPATQKMHAYFARIASFKAEQRDFLLELMKVWFSDDNAIVRERLRRAQISMVTPHIAAIIRQGIAEGAFTLTDPDHMARVVLALILDVGDEAGQLWLARQAGEVDFETVSRRFLIYETALERVLGVAPGTLRLTNEETLRLWFEAPFGRDANPPLWTTDPPGSTAPNS